jgi:hypothetical protein
MNKFLIILFLIVTPSVFSQYGNEWIDYNKKYYSLKIAEDGIYKIDYNTITASGANLSGVSPENFQLFGFEKEQPILVEDGGDGSFDEGDYILFYGQKNTSWLDSLIYDSPENVLNKYYPLYNDTITYFLTWNNLTSNKRITEETDINFATYTPENYFLKTNYIEHHNRYAEGYKLQGLSYSAYVDAEGWVSNPANAVSASSYIDNNIPTPYAYTLSDAPNVIGNAVSVSYNSPSTNTSFNHHLRLEYGNSNTVLHDIQFYGYKSNKLNIDFPANNIVGNTTRIRHQLVNDLGAAADYQSVAYVELTYPHLPNLENANYIEFFSENHSTASKKRYDLTNFGGINPTIFAINKNEIKKIPASLNTGTWQIIIPNSTHEDSQKIIFCSNNSIKNVTNITAVNGSGTFTNYSNTDFNNAYIIISNKKIQTSIDTYKNYRESTQGGNFNVVVAYQDELNMQFGGGVPKHIMGLRRFQHYAYDKASIIKPSNVFLIGKGVRSANESINTGNGTRQSTSSYNYCLVPSFGYPSSDLVITNHLNGNRWTPLIPIGRLAAKDNNEVIAYLNKVKEFETAQDSSATYDTPSKYWQKNVLHFGGGATESEQNTFKYYLTLYENLIEGPYFGGNVNSFYKTVSDPIDPVTLYEVNEYINEGVSLMTFFGHASATGFDQNVDDPENWDNKGKYPVVIGNACSAGNIHEPNASSTSEKFVLIEDKGAIALLANVKNAFSNGLHSFSFNFFTKLARENYGSSIGKLVQLTIQEYQNQSPSFSVLTVLNQMTLHGDPALRINPHNKPELEITQSSLFITPEVVDLTVDTIDVNIVIRNLGRSAIDTFAVELTRTFPNNGGDSLYTQLVPGINYNDTIVFRIPLYANQGTGINSFNVKVDQPSVITEQYDEVFNNQITKQVIFDIDGIYPIWPYNYAVVPNDTITLKGSTVNPFAQSLEYRFEIDTTDLFNSPFKRYKTINSLGGVVEVEHDQWLNENSGSASNLILEDSMVYFWRTSVNDPNNMNWTEHSFQYIKGKSGWGQDHFFQFKNNDFSLLNYNRENRQLEFEPAYKIITSEVYGNATGWLQTAYTMWLIDGEIAEYNFCTIEPAILVGVIDPVTLEPWGTRWFDGTNWQNPTHDFGNSNDNGGCRNRVERHFAFYQNNPTQMLALENMLTNEIPEGHYVIIYTARYLNYPQWDANSPQLYSMFQNLGSTNITAGQTTAPYIGYYTQGDVSTYTEVYGSSVGEHIVFEDTLWGFDYSGFETSTIIGPSTNWETVYWKQNSLENPTTDTTRLQIFGRTFSGAETLLIDTLFTNHDSISNFNNLYSADEYPYLRLSSHQIDTVDFTPAQIDGWHVLYDHIPEAALSSTNGYYLSPTDTVFEGQELEIAFDVKNISDLPMDSLLINYWIEDNNHNIIPISYPRQDSLRVNGIIRDTIKISSLNLREYNSLWVEVNPYINNYETDQLEQYHFNNIGQIPFYIHADDENPILDVTFNGYHILNGDLIAPSSEIIMSLKDESDFLIMSEEADTSFFGIYLTDPNGNQKRVNFRNQAGEPILEWIPADANSKKFKIIYNGNFDIDGTYRLLVQASDKSGNQSGDFEYDIEFEIDHHSSITNLMNYPNPFSTQTQFVFTLTGAVIPDEFTIQIMTISGKVVKEITVDELGPIHIGRNITDYRWDGRDEYGDILANGVYLYRVITKINGESIDHRESGADKYIQHDFGKMYIIR